MSFITRIEKSKSFWFLVFASLIFFILRLPSLFEPYWYADEGIYQAVGMLLRAGHPLYSGAWENKPPLLLALYALLSSEQYLIRVASLLFGLASVWFFYYIAKRLFNNSTRISAIATAFYIYFFGTRAIEGNIANAENFMLLPILLGAYLFLHSLGEGKRKQIHLLFFSGLFLGLAFLTKVVGIFDFLAFGAFLVFTNEDKFTTLLKNKILPYVAGFTIPVFITTFYFLITNNLKDFLDAFIFQNVGYVGVENQLIIPQGLLILKMVLLGSFCAFLFFKRRSFSKSFLFANLWFAFSLFDVFFSQRPYTHYLIMLLPSFCLMIGLIIAEEKHRFFNVVFFGLAFLMLSQVFQINTNIVGYYKNFTTYYSGKKTTEEYQKFFDGRVPRNYEIARFIRANSLPEEPVLFWSDSAELYKLSNKTPITRYVASYHMTYYPTGVSEMIKAIENKKPKFIVTTPETIEFPASLRDYKQVMNIEGANIYEKQF